MSGEHSYTYKSGELEAYLAVPDGYHPPPSFEYQPYEEGAPRVLLTLVEGRITKVKDVDRSLNAILGLRLDWERGENMVDDLIARVLSAVEGGVLSGDDMRHAASALIQAREHVQGMKDRR